MATQMSSARRGVPTDQMRQVAQDEDVELPWLVRAIASGSVIIPSNTARPQQIHNVGIGKGMKTKVNVNIGTSTLNVDIDAEIEKAHTAIKYHADTIMDLSDGGDVGEIRRSLLAEAPITFGTVLRGIQTLLLHAYLHVGTAYHNCNRKVILHRQTQFWNSLV